MRIMRINTVVIAVLLATGAHTQSYPAKPVRLIVPVAPGGNLDLVARSVAQQLSDNIGQQILVENRPGASSLVGTQFVAKAAPDGYTLLVMANTFAMVPAIVKALPAGTVDGRVMGYRERVPPEAGGDLREALVQIGNSRSNS